jgi:surface carbohydrate biosynthesis protein
MKARSEMGKPRIVIRAFTCRRDVAMAELLARILKHEGCDVLVTSVRDFERTLRLWRPDVAVVNVFSKITSVKSRFPNVGCVFLDGEGHTPAHLTLAKSLSREVYRAMDIVLLWNETIRKELIVSLSGENFEKMHVVGNPNHDLIYYRPATLQYDRESKSIGFVCRFPNVNNFSGESPIRNLTSSLILDEVIVQSRSFAAMINLARHILRNSDFVVSIRPHPNEQIETYLNYKMNWFGEDLVRRVEIDGSLCFGHWAARQRAILSPTSTSFLEAYLLGVPVINIDRIAGTDQFNKDYAELAAEWQAAGTTAHDCSHLMNLLTSELPTVQHDPVIEKQLQDYCDANTQKSACLRAARIIAEYARKRPRKREVRLPIGVVDAIDEISFRRISRYDPLHHNMNYRRGFHALPPQLDEIANNILMGRRINHDYTKQGRVKNA